MGFLDIKLNLGTALISCLAVGIGIDYTIHFI
jgi:predicted RND superfamily exporter protein